MQLSFYVCIIVLFNIASIKRTVHNAKHLGQGLCTF